MKPTGDMSVEAKGDKPDEKYRQPEAYDVLADGMQRTMLANHHSEIAIMRGLNARSLMRLTFSREQVILRDEQVSADIAQLVLDSDWTVEQKYSFALANRERARLWAQMIALLPELPKGTLNRLASLAYTTDQYIWDEDVLVAARVTGAMTRWAATKPDVLQQQLATALSFLERAPAGTRVTLTNGRRADDACVEINFPGPAVTGAA